jgi:hypothetical protein
VVFGELGNFLSLKVDFRVLCTWFWVVLGKSGNFPIWGVDLGHCVGGFGWFWGSQAIFVYGELIWGTL